MKERIISLALAICMSLSVFPTAAFAETPTEPDAQSVAAFLQAESTAMPTPQAEPEAPIETAPPMPADEGNALSGAQSTQPEQSVSSEVVSQPVAESESESRKQSRKHCRKHCRKLACDRSSSARIYRRAACPCVGRASNAVA